MLYTVAVSPIGTNVKISSTVRQGIEFGDISIAHVVNFSLGMALQTNESRRPTENRPRYRCCEITFSVSLQLRLNGQLQWMLRRASTLRKPDGCYNG